MKKSRSVIGVKYIWVFYRGVQEECPPVHDRRMLFGYCVFPTRPPWFFTAKPSRRPLFMTPYGSVMYYIELRKLFRTNGSMRIPERINQKRDNLGSAIKSTQSERLPPFPQINETVSLKTNDPRVILAPCNYEVNLAGHE